jgi:transposase
VRVSTPSDDQFRPPSPAGAADPAPRPSRRVFSPEYKLAMLAEYENAPNGEKGAVLRREGLYSSHIIEWTRARDAGALTSGPAEPAKRVKKTAEQVELEKLRRRNEKLESDLKKTRMALDIMGKAHALLEELSESAENDEPPKTS